MNIKIFTYIIFICFFVFLNVHAKEITRSNGAPVGDNQNSLSIGQYGEAGILLQDNHLIEKLAHFDRERIPERVVHARGIGAFGTFISKNDLSDITVAAPFSEKGKKTKVFVRFSTVIHGNHSPETLRDPRGFAMKFYTEEGNWDLVGNNLPVFFIRDAIKFPDLVHSLKPNPKTNIQDPNRFFDFFANSPETTHMFTRLYSTFGIPASYRQMEGSSVHAYKFVNKKCEWKYVKFTLKPQQGIKGLTPSEAAEIQKDNFNNLTEDLYGNIEKKNYPVWDVYIQLVDQNNIDKFDFVVVDPTKIWPENLAPMIKVGELTLNEIPGNFFQNTEQSAFAPNNMIPGIEPSEDRLLQGRLFSYADTQRYRLGVNHQYLKVNAPIKDVSNNNRDGAGYSPARTGVVNYEPSSNNDLLENKSYSFCHNKINGNMNQASLPLNRQHNFVQAGEFYRSLSDAEKNYLIEGLSNDLKKVKNNLVRNTICAFCYKANNDYGIKIAAESRCDMSKVRELSIKYLD